ncbi:hypothetical protein RRF57_013156 [Xylaria bambusicola]|uniref:Uncharacterized protein n=1 Tax=Xylaria bambusicola TaxID=326684 RepID=A0AAN7V2I3_9PEZI
MVLPKHRWLPGWVAEFAAAAELPSSMCFGESFAVPIYDRIDEGEYYRHVFAHPTGISHKADGSKEGINTLGRPDAFSYAVLDRSKKMDRTEGEVESMPHQCLG